MPVDELFLWYMMQYKSYYYYYYYYYYTINLCDSYCHLLKVTELYSFNTDEKY